MAAICPNCHHPEAVAYVTNDEGLHPFPCLGCNTSTIRSTPLGTLVGAAICATPHCAGSVRDEYAYDHKGRLTRLDRKRCLICGSAQTREVSHAPDDAERPLSDPRLQRVQG